LSYRWVVLASGTLAQASYSGSLLGIAVLLPALRQRYGLSLHEVGVLLAAPSLGQMLSFLPWGYATDRFGERVVAPIGLAIAGAVFLVAARATTAVELAVLLGLVGLTGASVNAASGRAVMHWFAPAQRGLALGIRQTAIPLGGALTAVALPALGGARAGLVALGVACLAGAVVAAAFLREGPVHTDDAAADVARPLRDARMWRLVASSVLLVFPQTAVFGYTVLFLHDHRGLSAAAAAHVFAVVQALGIATRIGAGRWSDAVGTRVAPLRTIAVVAAVLAFATGAAANAPLGLLLPVVVLGGVAAMSWNGLAFAAAAELAGRARAGASLGLQQTALAVAAAGLPPLFAAAVGGLGWGTAWLLTAAGPAAAVVVLRGLRA
jgi:sugar phosphate permease